MPSSSILNYAGQVAVNVETFGGNGLFIRPRQPMAQYLLKLAEQVSTIGTLASARLNGGYIQPIERCQQGMGAIDPALFTSIPMLSCAYGLAMG